MTKSPTTMTAAANLPASGLPSRRAALASLASISALTIPASVERAAAVDPVFAALERHRAAEAAFSETINPADETWCEQNGVECTAEAVSALEAAEEASGDALDELLDTPPLTLAGLRALVEYVAEIEDDFATGYAVRVLQTLLQSPILAV